ncbi:trypsin-like peptidase domain-containing protein [Catenulispora subtropica]|uniref:NACHT domain-containing protein n=1 Tax=Catenulispora subtropica TaxID=450798 RepID=A0ABP5EEU0_9ACTN
MSGSRSALAELLRSATLRTAPGFPRAGTGFFVAPGLILTCAHILTEPGDEPPDIVPWDWGDEVLDAKVVKDFRRHHSGLDLAVLATTDVVDHPVVAFAEPIEPGDELWSCWYPQGQDEDEDVVRLTYDGSELLRTTDGRVSEGFSGAPVLNARTGGVCGVLSPELIRAEKILALDGVKGPFAPTPDRAPWFHLLDDEQLAAGEWRHPRRRLRKYLKAARDAARDHSHAVYLPQRVIPRAIGRLRAESGHGDAQPLDAGSLLDGTRECVALIGGPGTGKSSMLRHLTDSLATGWLTGAGATGVPVLTPASSLTRDRSLPEALAEGVRAALGTRLADRDLPGLFEHEPIPGVPWIVMLDGLDEIADPEQREHIRSTIEYWLSHSSDHIFLTAGRPPLDPDFVRSLSALSLSVFEMENFAASQVPYFAEHSFRVLGVPDAARATNDFLAALSATRLERLAEVPLIASMLCAVFAEQPGKPLPRNKAELYEAVASLPDIAIDPDDDIGEPQPEGVGTTLVHGDVADLMRLAALYREGADFSDEILAQAAAGLETALAAGAFRFDVAEALGGIDEERGFAALRDCAADGGRPVPERAAAMWRMGRLSPGSALEAFRSIVLDPAQPWPLRDTAYGEMARLDTDKAVEVLLACVRAPEADCETADWAFDHLADLDADRLDGLLAVVAEDDTRSGHLRRHAADRLRARNHEAGVEALCGIAEDRSVDGLNRFWAAESLSPDEDRSPRVRNLIPAIASDPAVDGPTRLQAAIALAPRDRDLAVAAFEAILADASADPAIRIRAGTELAWSHPESAAGGLIALAYDRALPPTARLDAAVALGWINGSVAAEALLDLVRDATVPGTVRATAAGHLDWIHRQDLFGALTAVADDPRVEGPERTAAATRLARLSPADAVDPLAGIAADATVPSPDRIAAADELHAIDEVRGAAAFADLVGDASLPEASRFYCAVESGSAELLEAVAADPAIAGELRVRAAFELSGLDVDRGTAALAAVSADPVADATLADRERSDLRREWHHRREAFDRQCERGLALPDDTPAQEVPHHLLSNRVRAALLIGLVDKPRADTLLRDLREDPDPEVAAQAELALGRAA